MISRLLGFAWHGWWLLEIEAPRADVRGPIQAVLGGDSAAGEVERFTLLPVAAGVWRRVIRHAWRVRTINWPDECADRVVDSPRIRFVPLSAQGALREMTRALRQLEDPAARVAPRVDGHTASRARVLGIKYEIAVGDASSISPERYRWWQRHVEPRRRLTAASDSLRGHLVVVLVVDPASPDSAVRSTLESLAGQTCNVWELHLVGPAALRARAAHWRDSWPTARPVDFLTTDDAVPALVQLFADREPGDFGVLLFPGDRLAPHAVEQFLRAAASGVDVVYADDDRIAADGERVDPRFKPDWNPYLAYAMDYVGNACAFSARLLAAEGPLHRELTRATCHALLLAAARRYGDACIAHLAQVLLHHADIDTHSVPGPLLPGRATLLAADQPLVSVIIPTRDRVALLESCIEGLLQRTAYRPLEIIVVDNDSRDPATLDYLAQLHDTGQGKVLRCPGAFNFARLCNRAARVAKGELLLLLNNDIVVRDNAWLDELVMLAVRADVGCVGPMLLYPDDSVQHAGLVLGLQHSAGHAYRCFPADHPGYCGRLQARQVVSAVTAACLLVRTGLYRSLGGMDEQLAVAYNDVDFCLRVRAAGLHNLYSPYARLTHLESASRGFAEGRAKHRRLMRERAWLRAKWGDQLERDPYYNVNLTRRREAFSDVGDD